MFRRSLVHRLAVIDGLVDGFIWVVFRCFRPATNPLRKEGAAPPFSEPLHFIVMSVTVVTLCHTPHIYAVSRCDDPWREVRLIAHHCHGDRHGKNGLDREFSCHYGAVTLVTVKCSRFLSEGVVLHCPRRFQGGRTIPFI